jgi:hypothetical protein
MTITNGYCTLAELRGRLGNIATADTTGDTIMEGVITAVSRWIDGYTWRRFYTVAETRYYSANDGRILYTDDIVSTAGAVSSLKTDDAGDRTFENTWATTDYDLLPLNALLDNEPATMIQVAPAGNREFPIVERGVLVQATFGYSATAPDVVREACLLQSERLFMRKDAVFGIAGGSDIGGLVRLQDRLDPDVKALLDPLRRIV